LEKWLEEGLAEYFSTSRFISNRLALGTIHPNTYPVWWIQELATSPDLAENLKNGNVIPFRAIIANRRTEPPILDQSMSNPRKPSSQIFS
jgi:hypothetical protein